MKPAFAVFPVRPRAAAVLVCLGLCVAPSPAAAQAQEEPTTRPAAVEEDGSESDDADLTPATPPELHEHDDPAAAPRDVPSTAPRFSPDEVPRESWEGVARRLAAALTNPSARLGEEPLFLPAAQVWRFGRDAPLGPAALRGRFDGQVVASVLAGEYPQADLAQALAGDLKRLAESDPAAGLSPAAVHRLTPAPAQATTAELAMSRWLALSLRAEPGSPVAVIALWDSDAADRPDWERLSFLLLKAGRLPDGRYRLQLIRFGTAQEAVAEGF